ncbi:hypothetical protein A5736_23050 [Mycobacterium sp. SP-6446]|nr:hypothetical protein A5736_23050 [Mycobacterium sp. SP-6446]
MLMDIGIPPGLRWVSYLVGSAWPTGSESAMWRIGLCWQSAAGELDGLIPELERVRAATRTVLSGETAAAADEQFALLFAGDYAADKLVAAERAIGELADNLGTQIQYTKLQILATLGIAAATMAWAITFANLTGGQSLAEIPAAERAATSAIRELVAGVLDRIGATLARALSNTMVKRLETEGLLSAGLGAAQDAGIQDIQVVDGHRGGLDAGQLIDSTWSMAIAGLAGGLIGSAAGELVDHDGELSERVAKGALVGLVSGIGANAAGAWAGGGDVTMGTLLGAGLGMVHGGTQGTHIAVKPALAKLIAANFGTDDLAELMGSREPSTAGGIGGGIPTAARADIHAAGSDRATPGAPREAASAGTRARQADPTADELPDAAAPAMNPPDGSTAQRHGPGIEAGDTAPACVELRTAEGTTEGRLDRSITAPEAGFGRAREAASPTVFDLSEPSKIAAPTPENPAALDRTSAPASTSPSEHGLNSGSRSLVSDVRADLSESSSAQEPAARSVGIAATLHVDAAAQADAGIQPPRDAHGQLALRSSESGHIEGRPDHGDNPGGRFPTVVAKVVQDPPATLTARQRDVMTRLAGGLTTREIATDLGIGTRAVHNLVKRVFASLGAKNRIEAMAILYGYGLLDASLHPDPPRDLHARIATLSEHEREVLTLVAQAETNGEIAAQLHISEHAVGRDVWRIMAKLRARTRIHALAMAWEGGLIAPTRQEPDFQHSPAGSPDSSHVAEPRDSKAPHESGARPNSPENTKRDPERGDKVAGRDATAGTLVSGPLQLSPVERKVILLLTEGNTEKEIAARLGINEGAVKAHAEHLLTKLGARNNTHLVVTAYRHGLVDLGSPADVTEVVQKRLARLPTRDRKVISLLAQGLTEKEVADRMGLGFTERTVNLCVERLLNKLNARGLTHLVVVAHRCGRIDLGSPTDALEGREERQPNLTVSQAQVISLIAEGRSNIEIAGQLHISERTVKTHVRQLLTLLRARNRTHLVMVGYRHGLLDPGLPADVPDVQRELLANLMPREVELMRLFAEGYTNKEIADRQGFADAHTTTLYVWTLLAKLGVRDRIELVALAYRSGVAAARESRPGERELATGSSATARAESAAEDAQSIAPAESRSPPPITLRRLTEREMRVVGLLAEGLDDDEIGERAKIDRAEVDTELRGAAVKLGARTRAHLVAMAYDRGWASAPKVITGQVVLTDHQRVLIALLATGNRVQDIATRFGVPLDVIESWVSGIQVKLGGRDNAGLVASAYQLGVLAVRSGD